MIRSVKNEYDNYLNIIGDQKKLVTKDEAEKIERKMLALTPWLESILETPPTLFNGQLKPLMLRILKNLETVFAVFIHHSALKWSESKKDWVFFIKSTQSHTSDRLPIPPANTPELEETRQKVKEEAEKLVEDIEVTLPTTALPEWTPKVDSKKLPKNYPTPDPDYTPQPLPTPLNDWAPQ